MLPRCGILLAVLCLVVLPSHARERDLAIAVEVDPTGPEKEGAVWLAYVLARARYVGEHIASYPRQIGPITPLFEEEVEARSTVAEIYEELRAKDRELDVPYFNDLVRVAKGGFVREYVWHYLRQPAWKQVPADLKMEPFEAWRRTNLAEHKAIARGRLRFEEAKK